jgi:hypothetical protein
VSPHEIPVDARVTAHSICRGEEDDTQPSIFIQIGWLEAPRTGSVAVVAAGAKMGWPGVDLPSTVKSGPYLFFLGDC